MLPKIDNIFSTISKTDLPSAATSRSRGKATYTHTTTTTSTPSVLPYFRAFTSTGRMNTPSVIPVIPVVLPVCMYPSMSDSHPLPVTNYMHNSSTTLSVMTDATFDNMTICTLPSLVATNHTHPTSATPLVSDTKQPSVVTPYTHYFKTVATATLLNTTLTLPIIPVANPVCMLPSTTHAHVTPYEHMFSGCTQGTNLSASPEELLLSPSIIILYQIQQLM